MSMNLSREVKQLHGAVPTHDVFSTAIFFVLFSDLQNSDQNGLVFLSADSDARWRSGRGKVKIMVHYSVTVSAAAAGDVDTSPNNEVCH